MIHANPTDKTLVVDILVKSFNDNKSVNYIVKQDGKRAGRLRKLMEYAFDKCSLFGDIFLSDDKKACALVVLPDQKKTTIQSISLDLNLVLSVIGLLNVKKALNRETRISQLHPKTPYYFLWFLGVEPLEQNKGIGSKLLREVIADAVSKGRPIYLETFTLKNIPWYEKFGFAVYNKPDLGYDLHCLKKE